MARKARYSSQRRTAVLFLLASAAVRLQAADLYWGADKGGGDGSWSTSALNWWNGSANIAWPADGSAVFAGTAGRVQLSSNQRASALRFVTPGYVVNSGSYLLLGSPITVTTDADATVSFGSFGPTLIKEGSAKLIVPDGYNGSLQINAGEVDAQTATFDGVTMANAAGVVLTLGASGHVNPSGGGNLGGVVQPESGKSITLSGFSGTTFGGILQDNGTGKLSIKQSDIGLTTLTNANTYSGTTMINTGIVFSDHGSATASSAFSVGSGTLSLDNSTVPLDDRLSDAAPVTLSGGTLALMGHATVDIHETLGPLSIAGSPEIKVTQPGTAAALLSFPSLNRQSASVLSINGNGRVQIAGLTTANGILPAYLTRGSDWATLDGDGAIVPFASYADLATASPEDNVQILGPGTASLTASASRNSLKLQNDGSSPAVLDLGSSQLTLTSGGVLSTGTGGGEIRNGRISSGTSELLVQSVTDLKIQALIVDGPAPLTLLKVGAGKLTLTGQNTYTGDTIIERGILAIASDDSLGLGGHLVGGSLQALGNLTLKDRFAPNGSISIDTNGFSVALSGTVPFLVRKLGAGTLTLPAISGSQLSLLGGKLVADGAGSGSIQTQAGTTLEASGSLSYLSLGSNLRLNLGGAEPAALQVSFVSSSYRSELTLDFDVGATASDSFSITGAFDPKLTYLFAFHDLGDAEVGVDYPLIAFPTTGVNTPVASAFSIAPEAVAQGWRGTFRISSRQAVVNFSQVPEPGVVSIFTIGGLMMAARRRGRSQRSRKAPRPDRRPVRGGG